MENETMKFLKFVSLKYIYRSCSLNICSNESAIQGLVKPGSAESRKTSHRPTSGPYRKFIVARTQSIPVTH